jgi:hypothetical protein
LAEGLDDWGRQAVPFFNHTLELGLKLKEEHEKPVMVAE